MVNIICFLDALDEEDKTMVKEQLTELIKLVTNGATPTEQISFDGWFHNLNDIQDGIRGTVFACVYTIIGDIKQYTNIQCTKDGS